MLLTLIAFAIAATPEALVADKPMIDRGDLRIGPSLVESFILLNRGTDPVTITEVKTTCGCLAPVLDRRELAPGEKATLKVEVNTLSQPAGPIAWPVRVTHNGGSLELTLQARLIAEIRVEPAAVVFQIRQPRSATLTITDTRPKPFRVTAVGATCSHIKAALLPGDDATTTRVRLTATPDGSPGTRSEFAWITTDDPLYPQIKVPVTLTILPRQRVSANPPIASLAANASVTVQLRDREERPVVIEKIECDGPVMVRPNAGPGTLATLKMSIDPSKWNAEPWTGAVRVHLREPLGEVVTIPVEIR